MSANPILVNRIPEPGETGVPVGTNIAIEISDTRKSLFAAMTNNVVLAQTRVYINNVLAFDAGVFQTGFTGGGSAHSELDGQRSRRIVIDPTSNFAPLVVVAVRVETQCNGIGVPQVFNYSFTTEDLIAPKLVSAKATDHMTIRVVTSEALSTTALDAANWSIDLLSTSLDDGLPAVPLDVAAVAEIDTTTYDLTTDIEMTGGALYRVTGSGAIADLFANLMVAPDNVATFTGFTCPRPADRDFDLFAVLPALNQGEDFARDLEKFVACLQEVADLLLCDIDAWTDILDPDAAPEAFVDAMLADLGNPFGAFVLSEIDKRRLVEMLAGIFKKKGTDAGIIDAVRFFLGIEVTISTPAFDGVWLLGVNELGYDVILGTSDPKTRYSFVINTPALTTEEHDRIVDIANYLKAAHTHLIGLTGPAVPQVIDHWEIGLSQLGIETLLH